MTYCDLCEEFTTDETDCTWCGHRLEVPEEVPAEVDELADPAPRRWPLTPFSEAIAPVREARWREVNAAAAWAMANGLPCDRDVLALCFELLERHRGPNGFRLARPDVNRALAGGFTNWSSMHGTLRPDDEAESLWIVLHHLAETGGLDPGSDPLPALLEPLQCYGRLGDDGREMPDDVDVDFACQCFLPHDPACPEGLVQFIVGRDRESYEPFVVHADIAPRSIDPPVSAFTPLFRLARRLRASGGVYVPRVEEFDYLGRIPASRLHPEMWMYLLTPVHRRGFDPLVLDEHGRAFRAREDRRRKLGYRWTGIGDDVAMHASGVAARESATDRRPRWWDDDLDGLRAG